MLEAGSDRRGRMIGESGSHAVCLAFLRGMCFLQQNVQVAGRGRGEMRCIGLFLGKHRPLQTACVACNHTCGFTVLYMH